MADSGLTRVSTGVDGLDEVLHGGLIAERHYLLRGEPGTGKTILAFHFATEGVAAGDDVLFINLEETTDDVRANAAALGFDLEGVEFLDLSPDSDHFAEGRTYDVFASDEVEGEPVTGTIHDRIEAVDPDRVVVDPVSQLRYLTPDEYQFRKQVMSLGRYLAERGATTLYTSQSTEASTDEDLQFLVDGVVELTRDGDGRHVSVPKFRGSGTRSGTNSVRIGDDGLTVYPELDPGDDATEFVAESISSGVPEIDQLLHGGIERGTVTVISGPSGAGKTTLGTQFMKEAAGRGERSVIYLLEENRHTFETRGRGVNIPVAEMVERGTLNVEPIQPMSLSPQEFAAKVRHEVEVEGAEIVMVDGIAGYRQSVRGVEDELDRQLQLLTRYCKNHGVTVILIEEISSLTGEFTPTEAGISYLADNVVFLRHLELQGELRKAIGVLKKRTSDFERTLREFEITQHGISVGEPLSQLRGILTGTPEFQRTGSDDD
jgi:circadian clock protein KaiC